MVPVAGSAYTYAYATMGELFAWIIGWDLVLEYAVGSATVATGWSGYFQNVLAKLGIQLPLLVRESPWRYDAAVGQFLSTGSVINLPAIIIVAIVTAILVKGIQESASFNAAMVDDQAGRRALRHRRRRVLHRHGELAPVRALRLDGRQASSASTSPARPTRAARRSGCWRARRSSSSPTSASTPSPRTPRRPGTRSATCRSASSRRSSSAPSSTSRSSRC